MKARVNASGDTLARIRELEADLGEEHRQNVRNLARAEKAEALLRTAEEIASEEQREHIEDYNALIHERDALKARVAELVKVAAHCSCERCMAFEFLPGEREADQDSG